MAEYPLRKRVFPQEMEIAVSQDGEKFTPLEFDMPHWPDGRKDFQIVTFGTPVSGEARYVRIKMFLLQSGVHLSEVIVN